MASLAVDSDTAGSMPARPRGRPREFDRDDVLGHAMTLFWEKGFEASSLSDIVEATGLNKSSLYNAFGSKNELFSTALERYVAMRTGEITELLTTGTQGLADIEKFVDFMREWLLSVDGGRGCFAVNTSTELGLRDDDVTKTSLGFRNEVRTGLRAALSRAEAAGEITAGTVHPKAEILLAFLLALPVIARSGGSPDELNGQFAAARSLLAEWRL